MTSTVGLVERLTREIVDTIRSENLQPGQTLPSAKVLAARFEVTVPTVREALRRLEATGSVELKHEEIKDLMPAMQMEFFVKDKKILEGLKVGDKVDFVIEYKHPQETITSIKKAQ